MAGATYINPFTPETPIGAGLQNIAMALAGKRASERAAMYNQQGGMYDAHNALYREQAAKASVERRLAERLLRDQSPDAQDELIAASAGVPSYTVRGYRDTLAGANPGYSVADYADVAPQIRRSMLAVRPAYADKTINPVNIAQALDLLDKTDTRNDVIGDRKDARKVAQGFFATSGSAPYHAGESGSTNLLTGEQELNPLGTARTRAQNATAAQHELETRTGVKLGPPVVVDDNEAGTIFTSPSAAVGRRPGLNPNSAGARPRTNADGSAVTDTELKPIKASKQDADLLLGGIDRAVGGGLRDKTLEGAIMQRAQEYFGTPGSEHYGQHEGASRAAVMDMLPQGASPRFGFAGDYTPKGEPNMSPGPISATGPRTTRKTVTKGGGAAPSPRPAAPAKPAAATAYISPSGKQYSAADVEFTAKQRGMTVEQVVQQLKLRPGA